MPEAAVADVRVEIGTKLDDPDVNSILARIEREWQRVYGADQFDDAQHIADFEATLAALRIAEGVDRRAEQSSAGPVSTTYETSEIANLRKRVRRLDPGDEFGHSGRIRRDTRRHTSTPE